MRLKKYTDFSLRVLLYTAANEQKVSIKDISDTFYISTEHIRKVVHQLSVNDYIKTTRGRNGGIVLARDPREINIGAVIRLMENDFYLVECFDGEHNQCVITPACKLRSVVGGEAMKAFFNVLNQYTLADLMENKDELKELMQWNNEKN
ncbi:nitrite-sensitive transcriptional repressor NsrR [Gracilibacillus boraciitolerans JCM 21714]|uniref:HTH-type transcriptional regulator NsrR n=1 Tax=Gracilibacillus boraciitolerans JCM 21714 TaxID=1298598 RepID=W4VQB9_9BACI|nr:Rrf2 family transcriptional regulator [Gracilibacillus boraciitolerans]GAE95407.1 nitrite-sensitive transcriptional repressor NsrR [Gracilibacillus boraciitolerans JCM 21714]